MDKDLDLNLSRAKHYCSLAERSVAEMEKKLQQWKVCDDSIEIIMDVLKCDDYVNDERFVRSFISDKFRFNKWGKIKIAHSLKQAGVQPEDIKEGMSVINDSEYYGVAIRLAAKKMDSLGFEYDPLIIRQKTLASMMARGFEPDFVNKIIEELFKERGIK